MIEGIFYGLSTSDLATLKTNVLAAINAAATAGVETEIAGRRITRINPTVGAQLLAEIIAAQSYATASNRRKTHTLIEIVNQ